MYEASEHPEPVKSCPRCIKGFRFIEIVTEDLVCMNCGYRTIGVMADTLVPVCIDSGSTSLDERPGRVYHSSSSKYRWLS